MKKISSIFILSFLVFMAFAQEKHPAKFSEPKLSKSNPTIGETLDIIFDVTIEEGWYLYSSDFDPDLGPIVTTFDYKGSEGVEFIGGIKAINPKKEYDDLWGGDYTYFEPKGQFKQTIKITKSNPKILAKVEFQTCQHDGSCISDKQKFTFDIKTSDKKVVEEVKKVEIKEVVLEKETKVEPKEVKIEIVQDSSETEEISELVESEEDEKFLSVKSGIAKGKDGFEYVNVNNEWFKVPQDNSAAFYKKYLTIGGKHEK